MHRFMHSTKAFQRHRQLSFWSEFQKSIQRQTQENKKLQEDVKLLANEQQKLSESLAVKGTKTVINKTGEITSKVAGTAFDIAFKNPVSKATGQAISSTVETVADITQKVAEPILDTKAAKTVQSGIKQVKNEVIGITGNPYWAEYESKEVREQKRVDLEKARAKQVQLGPDGLPLLDKPVEVNEDASGIVMHKSGRLTAAWEKFKSESALGQTLHAYTRALDESDSAILRQWRRLKDTFKSEESEAVRVIKAFKTVDPRFNTQDFLSELAHFIVPELLEASLQGDKKVLTEWLGERSIAPIMTVHEQNAKRGITSHCKVIDIRNTDIAKIILLEDEFPVIVATFQTTEVMGFKNKAGEFVIGAEDNVVTGRYALAFTKKQLMDPEAEFNPKTNGWHVIQWSEQKS